MRNSGQRLSKEEEAIEATAAAWIALRDEGLTPEDEARLAEWRQGDPRREAAIRRLEGTWKELQALRHYRPGAYKHPDRDLLAKMPRRNGIRSSAFAVAALAAAVVFAAVWWWRPAQLASVATNPYETAADGYERVALPDGSVMELNASTRAEVKFTAAERRIQLSRGEAHFIVAKNKARPFLVGTGGVSVRAVGTKFDVKLDAETVEVLVTEGTVQLERPGVAREGVLEMPKVTAGERIVLNRLQEGENLTHAAPEEVTPSEIGEALSWRGPRLVFVDTPLSEVVAEFNRQNQVQIVLGDRELEPLSVGGSFRADNVEAFVRLISSGNGIVAEHQASNLIVLRKANR